MTERDCLAFAFLALTSVACAGCGGGGNTSGSGGGTGEATCGHALDDMDNLVIVADPANNYTFTSELTFDVDSVAADAELTFDWSGVTTDLLGQPLDPMADIDSVNLMLWRQSEAELPVNLNNDALEQRDLAVIATIFTEKTLTTAQLFDLTSVGMPLEPCQILPFVQLPDPDPAGHPECEDGVGDGFDPATHTYTLTIATGETLGQGTRMLHAFKLDPDSDNTELVMASNSTSLDFSADLTSLVPVSIPVSEPAMVVDWTDISINAMGNEFEGTRVNEVLVARYSVEPEELEASFLELEPLAEELFRGEVTVGTTLELSSLTNEAGAAFTGIDDAGTWILALLCGTCSNPAPWYLTVLTPCAAP